jgi:hypothetical protein
MRQVMRYRVYSGPRGSAEPTPLDKEKMLFKEFDNLDAALGWAGHLGDSGRAPLLIEGDDGTRLGKLDIAAALAPRTIAEDQQAPARGRST